MRKIEFRPRASYDIESIITYLSNARGAPQAAENWYEEFCAALTLLREQPELGRVFQDERLQIMQRRTYLVGNYRVFYTFNKATLLVWRIVHTSQNMNDYALIDW